MIGLPDDAVLLHGVDFTSAPGKRKGITIATGTLDAVGVLTLLGMQTLHDFAEFSRWLALPGPWLGGFDLPFSLPRELVEQLGWPTKWQALMTHYAAMTRLQVRSEFKAFCDARPAGSKFAHRATDGPAASSPSMKWVNPPVAYMLHAGVPLLIDAGVTLYGMHAGDTQRLAFEAYPALVARSVTRQSYKSDERRKQTPERRAARVMIVDALEQGSHAYGIGLAAGRWRDALLDDGSGDLLDAVLCAILAAWGWQRRTANFGLPAFDTLEGWIIGA
ncbi:MAG: DUF429 domain-containing protein [Janthinobacterium lividum]